MNVPCPRCGSVRKNVGAMGKCDRFLGFHSWHFTPPSDLPPTRTHVSGPLNSTRFTNCCGAAVVELYPGNFQNCPVCLREVER